MFMSGWSPGRIGLSYVAPDAPLVVPPPPPVPPAAELPPAFAAQLTEVVPPEPAAPPPAPPLCWEALEPPEAEVPPVPELHTLLLLELQAKAKTALVRIALRMVVLCTLDLPSILRYY
jgi:hypothetical protein